ncbi:MAG TPA: tRNA lysidine(34) synthetase TilS [Dehalococcoidia bacterium]|nr:tRNA lysidine(34) synthetase TilS [Dehalococcoidia bacterium]
MAQTAKFGSARLEKEVAAALGRAGYSGNDTQLVVGVSGGVDSVSLIHCLSRIQKDHRLRLHVAHLNHQVRGEEADRDAQFVSDLAKGLGLDATVEEGDVPAYQKEQRISSFEQAARELRYQFLARVALTVGARAVAVAHTSDDLAETLLLHILRGSGTRGLQGMTELSQWPGPLLNPSNPLSSEEAKLSLFRPILRLAKADTLRYCQELGQSFREDSSNDSTQFTRNRIRLSLLPLLEVEFNPKVRESLVRLSKAASLELEYMDGEADILWRKVAVETGGGIDFRLTELSEAHPALQRLVLRKGYSKLAGDARRLTQRHLDAMADLVQSTPRSKSAGRSLDLPRAIKLHRSYGYLRMSREPSLHCPFPRIDLAKNLPSPLPDGKPATVKAGPWEIALRNVDCGQVDFVGSAGPKPGFGSYFERNRWTAYFDRESIGNQLQVRTWIPGDRFQPLGMTGDKKLQDFFTDAQVPREWRKRIPLLVTEGGIAWVVGYRIADWARVKTDERQGNQAVEVVFTCEKETG